MSLPGDNFPQSRPWAEPQGSPRDRGGRGNKDREDEVT
jgi:hypothetical protein